MQTSSLAMSWLRKLHQVPESSPEYPPTVPLYSAPYGGSPPAPPATVTSYDASPPAPSATVTSYDASPPAPSATVPSYDASPPAPPATLISYIASPPAPPATLTSYISSPPAPPGTVLSYDGSSPAPQAPVPPNDGDWPSLPPTAPQYDGGLPPRATVPPYPSPYGVPRMSPALSLSNSVHSRGLAPGALVGLVVGTVIGGLILLVAVGIFVIFHRRGNSSRQDERPILPNPDEGLDEGPTTIETNFFDCTTETNFFDCTNDEQQIVQSPIPGGPSSSSGSPYTFSYEELAKATDCFSKTNFLGEGGYGSVHKGVLPDGKKVAIKQLRLDSKQGEKEFMTEVEIISRVHHKNLVSLVGYCSSKEHKILVYEFVPNGTLHWHLHGKEKTIIDWPTRMEIALGSANGLAYLHEGCHPQIIHRDIKAANILLGDKFVVKVADFGLAKFSSDTKSYVSTAVKGTWGYLDPAYLNSEKLTDKADIFSFGVVLLELITGREPKRDTEHLYQWAKPLVKQALENDSFDALIDPSLQNKYRPSEMRRMVACAAACVRDSASNRPKMSQIVRALEGNLSLEDLNGGIKPGDTNEQSKPGTNNVSALQIER